MVLTMCPQMCVLTLIIVMTYMDLEYLSRISEDCIDGDEDPGSSTMQKLLHKVRNRQREFRFDGT